MSNYNHLDVETAKEARRIYKEFQGYVNTLEMRGWKVSINQRSKELIIRQEQRL